MEGIDPFDLARALGEIPLFRELQRLLTSQRGPVNWEFANQIAKALSTAGTGTRSANPEEIAEFEQACRIAEMRLRETTGMEPSSEINEVRVLDRHAWAQAALEGFEPLIDRLAVGLRGRGPSQEETPAVFGGFLDACAPLLLGIQVGFMSGYLSRRVLGQYDLCYPTGEPGRLYFVYPNIVELENELGFDPKQFRMWLALHEVAHQLEFQSVHWLKPYFISLVERYIDGAEIDSGEVGEKLRSLADPEELERILERPNELLPMLMTNSQQAILSEIQALMAVLEGFAEWAMDESGKQMLPELDKMREGMNRRRAERSVAEKLLEQLVGLDLKLEQYRAGERFIRAVASAGRTSELWESPANLPSLQELSEPAKWLDRVPPNRSN
jgi:coenzyme F420 biosynthesis associated uncharacterized protein